MGKAAIGGLARKLRNRMEKRKMINQKMSTKTLMVPKKKARSLKK